MPFNGSTWAPWHLDTAATFTETPVGLQSATPDPADLDTAAGSTRSA